MTRPLTPSERSKLKRKDPRTLSAQELEDLWPRIWVTFTMIEASREEETSERVTTFNDPTMTDKPVARGCVPKRPDIPGQIIAFEP